MYRLGIPYLRASGGPDVSLRLYSFAIEKAMEIAPTPFVGITNENIIFDENLVKSIEAVQTKAYQVEI